MSIGVIASQAFSPNKIPGLSFWLDASDIATIIDSGGNVSAWGDKGKDGINLSQLTGVAQPKTGINTINGKNVISFNGTTQFIAASLSATIKMIFIVAKLESGFPSLSGLFINASGDTQSLRMRVAGNEFRGNGGTSSGDFTHSSGEMRINGVVSVPPAIALNTPFIISGVSVSTPVFAPQISADVSGRFWKGLYSITMAQNCLWWGQVFLLFLNMI